MIIYVYHSLRNLATNSFKSIKDTNNIYIHVPGGTRCKRFQSKVNLMDSVGHQHERVGRRNLMKGVQKWHLESTFVVHTLIHDTHKYLLDSQKLFQLILLVNINVNSACEWANLWCVCVRGMCACIHVLNCAWTSP